MGSSKQESTTETSPWGPAQDALKNILSQAGQLFDKNGGINAEFIDKELADLTPEMQGAIKNLLNNEGMKDFINSSMDSIKTGVSSIGQASGILANLAQGGGNITADQLNKEAEKLYDSELVASQKAQLQKSVQEGVDKNIQGINQRAGAAGGMGSSRAGVAEGVAIGEGQEAFATGAANIENAARQSAYAQALTAAQQNQQTQYGAAGALGSLGTSSGQLGAQLGSLSNALNQNALQGAGILQQQAQNVLNNKWLNAYGKQNAGWDILNKYLGVAGTIGSMGGSSKTEGKGGGNLFSDARLKDDVEVLQEESVTEEGEPIPAFYSWKWNAKAIALFAEQKYEHVPPAFGVIAQELDLTGFERFIVRIPTSVEGLDGSVMMVDYDSLMDYITRVLAV